MCTSSTFLLCFYRITYKHENEKERKKILDGLRKCFASHRIDKGNNRKEYKVNQGQRKEVIDVKSRYRRYQNNQEKKREESIEGHVTVIHCNKAFGRIKSKIRDIEILSRTKKFIRTINKKLFFFLLNNLFFILQFEKNIPRKIFYFHPVELLKTVYPILFR